ncbi:MAG: ribonuclease H-like domain-containing protein [Bryobacterales bacterium]|nr:ribonuclease H-like domain-containing protein [Bryobacterales bacterium]
MRDIREELDRLREKLRRMEQKPAIAPPPSAPASLRQVPPDLPPWEGRPGEDAFEASLASPLTNASQASHIHNVWSHPTVSPHTRMGIEDCVEGRVVETAAGKHFECEAFYPFSNLHGNFAVSNLDGMAGGLLNALCPEHGSAPSDSWGFLDTETIGLAGGAGSFAFLIGLGFVDADGFRVRQYFLREPSEEPSVLVRLASDLARSRTLITYNGRSFDAPLLETRYRMARMPVPFQEMPHLDLLFACRRLWKLRFESCKLTNLEREVLGFERAGDVPGFLIPSLYTNYLRTGDAGSLAAVFTHNAFDILSLACLTSLVAAVFENPEQARPRHPAECLGLGRWLVQLGRRDEALRFLWRAADGVIPEELLASILWEIATAERQLGRFANAQRPLEQLLSFPNRFQVRALEALSILFERRLPHLPKSLAYARQLEQREPSEASAARVERLVRKLRSRSGQQFLGQEKAHGHP